MRPHSRRSVLAAVSGGVVGSAAGCLGGRKSVSVLSAGSLAVVLDDHVGRRFSQQTGTAFHGEYYGSKAVMRMVEDGQKSPDVVISADRELLRDRLYGAHTSWDVAFGSNSLGIAYSPTTQIGERLDAGQPWYEVIAEAAKGDIAISDPKLDPLGYRAIQALRLAEDVHELDGFADQITATAYREPEEPRLLGGVDTGKRAAAIAYRNMALDHGLSFREFPDRYNFSNPAYADYYATVSYTTADGYTAKGAPIVYGATVLDGATEPASSRRFVTALANSSGLLEENGLTVSGFPTVHGTAPEGVIGK
ncbi:MAG: tungstate/molybdate binding protein [uncultured archaeon A07HR60]|nr:MAG: tungstate/molybdate binding protein [uncultured archaeon A07HR60]